MSILSDKDPCGWPMRRFLFLFLLSISGIPIFVNIKKYKKKIKKWPMSSQNRAKKITKNKLKMKNTKIKIKCVGPMSSQNRAKKITKNKLKMKNTKIKIKCVGGGNNLLYLHCLVSNTMPQLEQSSLQPSTDLQHRHLQTTSYNHLLLLHLFISRKGKLKQQQARNPLAGGLRSQKGLRPFNPLQRIGFLALKNIHT